MSTLKVNKIRDTSGSSDAITLDPNGGAVLAGVTTISTARVTSGIVTNTFIVGAGVTISESGIEASGIGITCANINGTQIGGRRNIIINGDCRVAQRGTSATSVSGQYKTVDRFSTAFGGADEAPTEALHGLSTSDTPYALGFRKSFHYTNGNQTSGAGSSDYLQPQYKIEAQDLATSGWDYTSSTSFITLSFWVKSSVAGDYTLNIGTHDGTAYRYFMEYTLVADTWKHVVFKIPGNSNLTVNKDNGHGATIMWYPFLGSDYVQADQENNWYASSNSKYGTTSTTNWWTTNDSTWEITGVQLEVGSQATAFEHRSYQEEFQLCKRYYQQYPEGPTADNYNCVPSAIMPCNNTTTAYYCPTLNPTMRSDPTFSSSGNFRMNGTASVNNVAVTAIGVYHNGAATPFQYASVASGLTAGQAVALSVNNDATAYIAYSAEL